MSPWQPVHLKQRRGGGELVIALGDLTPVAIDGAVEAKVMDDEGYGIRTLDHLRLDRRWAPVFKLDGGSMTFARGGAVHSGFIADMQFGLFVRPWLGLLLTAGVGGAGDEYGATLTRHTFGFEVQSLPLELGPLQLGGYVNVGAAAIASTANGSGDVEWGNAIGGGVLGELQVTSAPGAHAARRRQRSLLRQQRHDVARRDVHRPASRSTSRSRAGAGVVHRVSRRARQAQSWRRMASASRPSPIRTSSVRARVGAPGLAEREAGARAGALEEAAPVVAREVNEALRAHQRGAQPLDHREQRLGAAAAPDR